MDKTKKEKKSPESQISWSKCMFIFIHSKTITKPSTAKYKIEPTDYSETEGI